MAEAATNFVIENFKKSLLPLNTVSTINPMKQIDIKKQVAFITFI